MEWLQILKRLEGGEDETTEFKRGLGDLSAIGKTICAFANAEGGVLVLGVENDGQITGVREDPDRFKERLTSFLQTGCSQPISARTGSHHEAGHWVHWIEVPRQRGFEPLSHHGRVWTRRARSSVEPSPTELQDLYNTFGYIVTEERGIQGAPASHIDLDAFLEYLDRMGFETQEEPQPNTLDDLRNRGVLVDLGGETRGTLYGVLAFGKHPQRYPQTQNFRIECVAYSGDDRASEVLQVAPGRGRLDEQVNRAVGWFQGLGHFESYQRLVREDRHLLPRAALREALVNAAIHRDYAITGSQSLLEVFSDRVVVTSPGTLPNHVTVEQVRAGAHPKTRNDSMANYMTAMGFMEMRGRGWLVMKRAMRDFNDTEPELENSVDNRFVRVTFYLNPDGV